MLLEGITGNLHEVDTMGNDLKTERNAPKTLVFCRFFLWEGLTRVLLVGEYGGSGGTEGVVTLFSEEADEMVEAVSGEEGPSETESQRPGDRSSPIMDDWWCRWSKWKMGSVISAMMMMMMMGEG